MEYATHLYRKYSRYGYYSLSYFTGMIALGLVSVVVIDSTEPLLALASEGLYGDEISYGAIFVNNTTVVLLLALGGLFFGIPTVLSLGTSGLLIGITIGSSLPDLDPVVILALFLPHAVFEVPGLLVASVVGFRLPHTLYRYLTDRTEVVLTSDEAAELGILCLLSLSLITIAAFVESYVTVLIGEYLGVF